MSTATQQRTLVERFYGQRAPGVPSEKSLKFLLDLATERVAPSLGSSGEQRLESIGAHLRTRRPEQREVSRWIDFLLKQPVESAKPPKPVRCRVCRRKLKTLDSIKRGVGPVCQHVA